MRKGEIVGNSVLYVYYSLYINANFFRELVYITNAVTTTGGRWTTGLKGRTGGGGGGGGGGGAAT